MGFRTHEVMRGVHTFVDAVDGLAGTHPFSFAATWGPDRIRDWIDPRKPTFLWQELTGSVDAGGIGKALPCRGTLHLQYWPQRRIRYDFDFEAKGVGYRFLGDKHDLRPTNLLVSHTTCAHSVTERATGRLVSTGYTRFHWRDLPGLLWISRV